MRRSQWSKVEDNVGEDDREWERMWSNWPLAKNQTVLPLSEEKGRGGKHKGRKVCRSGDWRLEKFFLILSFSLS